MKEEPGPVEGRTAIWQFISSTNRMVVADVGWDGALQRQFEDLADGPGAAGIVLLIVPRRLPDLVRAVASRRRPSFRSPTLRAIKRECAGVGLRIRETYRVWPDPVQPRIVIPHRDAVTAFWLHRNGILVPGAALPLVGRLLRSSLGWPLAWFASPALVVLVERAQDDS